MKQCKECNKPCKKTYCSDECVAAKKHRNAYRTVVCKECQKPFECKRENANGKVYCSNECRQANGAKKPFGRTVRTFVCCSCVKECTRNVRNDAKEWTCGIECQRKKGWVEIDWQKRSAKAKAKFYKDASRKRYEKSEYRKWIILTNKNCLLIKEEDPWKRRCTSASSLLSHRMNPSSRRKVFSENIDWQEAFLEAIKRINAKTKRSMECGWNKKVTVIAGTLRRRRDLRNAKKNTLQHTEG